MIKVLAIDDEAPIRQWIAFCISRFPGFTCATAANAREGIEIWRAFQPEIILCDIEMPGMDGLEMLRQIRREDASVYMAVLTSHEDFDYARTALKIGTEEYILKTEMTEESLYAILDKARETVKKQKDMGIRTLSSRIHYLQALTLKKGEETIPVQELAMQGILLENRPVMAMDFFCEDVQVFEQNRKECFAGLQNIISFPLGNDHLILIANTGNHSRMTAALAAREAGDAARRQVCICCGISDVEKDPGSLVRAIHTAVYRCSLRFYEPKQKVFEKQEAKDISLLEENFQLSYMRFLVRQNFQEAYRSMSDFMQEAGKAYPSDIEALKKGLASALISFLHFAKDVSEDVDHTARVAKEEILAAASLEQVRAIIDAAFEPAAKNGNQPAGMTAQVRRAIVYMEQHYGEKISLGESAELAGFSPEHFSRIFSRETGVNYVTYLNNLRMRHAVELLETTDMKVYEIAEKVGFSSLSYFSTAFKKKFGQNPYEYQVNYQRGTIKGKLV